MTGTAIDVAATTRGSFASMQSLRNSLVRKFSGLSALDRARDLLTWLSETNEVQLTESTRDVVIEIQQSDLKADPRLLELVLVIYENRFSKTYNGFTHRSINEIEVNRLLVELCEYWQLRRDGVPMEWMHSW